jgi:translation initiation factor IF-3
MMAANSPQKRYYRINDQIRVSQVRLFIEDTPQGIVSIEDAKNRAFQMGLDLVEVVPHAKPPVCKIIDFKKWDYEEKIRKKEETRKQKSVASKEIQIRYCTEDHDLAVKVGALKKFLKEKRQVRIVMKFKNREITFKRQGEDLLKRIATMIEEFGTLNMPKLEGKSLVAQVTPK